VFVSAFKEFFPSLSLSPIKGMSYILADGEGGKHYYCYMKVFEIVEMLEVKDRLFLQQGKRVMKCTTR
jgi:hypothetical protein